ncbi:uncharacterized protein LOC128999873 [Macrosteles quadrilineatus]|uniref:uncharacterized protein LOC128999873 n=1 Tax=Macrosteles quadrilineatus TaxID=74068 RepID=UPI0023E131AD|nr:uncharacterized protein LOC128999873 [Macrosteles quadrilineatus]
MGYYQYCTSLLFEFWRIPFQVDYFALVKLASGAACEQCNLHTFGSILYGECLAFLGFVASLYDIYYLIAPYYTDQVKAPRLYRDLQLMLGTISTLVYLVLMLGLLLENAQMLVPWLVLEIVSIALLLTSFRDGHMRLFILGLSINNIMQISCVFLNFLRLKKVI